MAKVKVQAFSISVDGYGAGPGQDLANPLGIGGMRVHEWAFATRTFHQIHGKSADGATGVDDDFAARGFENVGAWIIGRNMFGPVRGPWPDESWKGWWGETPPYHTPVFVLTHHPRSPLAMAGETTFCFVTEGIEQALNLARAAAGDKDIRIGGGVATIQQYLRARLLDELHLAIAPTMLGSGELLFVGLDVVKLGYQCNEFACGEKAMHVVLRRSETNS